jgi:LmbE family N-acetylglucosaminyl deacetylase
MLGSRILILIPHPDDEVVGCMAAIGRARAGGARVFALYLTEGVPEESELWWWHRRSRRARVARRIDEADRVAELLGLESAGHQEVASRCLRQHLEPSLMRIRHAIDRTGADVVWTPAYEGGHQDHDSTNFLASQLGDRLPVFEFSEYNFAGGRIRSQQFFDRTGTEAQILLDDSERAMKVRALSIYRSEAKNLSYVRTVQEELRRLPPHDYSKPPHHGRTFYQRFQWVPHHPRVDRCQPEEVCRAFLELRSQGA